MKTTSGVLSLTKKDIECIKTVLIHCNIDISYGVAGSFGDGEDINEREIIKAKEGIQGIKWIINNPSFTK